jgi:hypothetical protein
VGKNSSFPFELLIAQEIYREADITCDSKLLVEISPEYKFYLSPLFCPLILG